MHFELRQRIGSPVDDVVAAFVDPHFYEMLDALPNLGQAEVVSHEVNGAIVHLRVRYRFTGNLSSAVRAAIDPAKLSWIEDAEHDLAARRVRFRMLADHYADRFQCSGTYRFEPAGDATDRFCAGDLRVRMPLVGHRVEKAIVSGLRDHLDIEADLVQRFIAESGG